MDDDSDEAQSRFLRGRLARYPDLACVEDFWLLDNRVGVRLIYDDGGRLIRLERMITSEVDAARCIRDAAWAAGTDLAGIGAVAVG